MRCGTGVRLAGSRAWSAYGVLAVRVEARGHGADIATAGYRPPDPAAGRGMGLWVARQLADVVHARASPTVGTASSRIFGNASPCRRATDVKYRWYSTRQVRGWAETNGGRRSATHRRVPRLLPGLLRSSTWTWTGRRPDTSGRVVGEVTHFGAGLSAPHEGSMPAAREDSLWLAM